MALHYNDIFVFAKPSFSDCFLEVLYQPHGKEKIIDLINALVLGEQSFVN